MNGSLRIGTNSVVNPSTDTWYEFRINVSHTGSATVLKARVWVSGNSEPQFWQADCEDDGTGGSNPLLTNGSFGVWSMGSGDKFWDDLEVTE